MNSVKRTLTLGLVLLVFLLSFVTPPLAVAQGQASICLSDPTAPCMFPIEGNRQDYVVGQLDFHEGETTKTWAYDYATPDWKEGPALLATMNGTGEAWVDEFENTIVVIRNISGTWESGYVHLNIDPSLVGNVEMIRGQKYPIVVVKNQKIGTIGNHGNSTAPHLHYWVRNITTGEWIKDQEQFWNWSTENMAPTTHQAIEPYVGLKANTTQLVQCDGKWTFPIPGVTKRSGAPFGGANAAGGQDFHNAEDFSKGTNPPLVAVASGQVVHADYWPDASKANHNVGHGQTVVIWHPDSGLYTYYAHMDAMYVSEGQWVECGQQIGIAGTTGYMTVKVDNDHVHFGVRKTGPEDQACFDRSCWVPPFDYLGKEVSGELPANLKLLENAPELYRVVNEGKFDWQGLTVLAVYILGLWIIYKLLSKLLGLNLRKILIITSITIIAISFVLPNTEIWLAGPVGINLGTENVSLVDQFFGDPRKDPLGSTGMIYTTAPLVTPVSAVSTGKVIKVTTSMFDSDDLWVEVGNGLYVRYTGVSTDFPEGKLIRRGELLGTATGTTVGLYVSSINPDTFEYAYQTGKGFVDPQDYLGMPVFTGKYPLEAKTVSIAVFLLVLALLWPRMSLVNRQKNLAKVLGRDLDPPFDWKHLKNFWILFALSGSLFVLGWYLISPYLMVLARVPLISSFVFLVVREYFRRRIVRGNRVQPLWFMISYPLMNLYWVVWVIFFLVVALFNPTYTYAQRPISVDLPDTVWPTLPIWEGNPNDGPEEAVLPSIPDYQWSEKSVIPEFQVTYWNGARTTFYIPPEIWAATTKAVTQVPGCNPLMTVIVAHSESPLYTNHTTENEATAMGTWQFIRGTWEWMMPGEPLSERANIEKSAVAACKYLVLTGVFDATTKAEFVNAFAAQAPVWNQYPPQAEYVWDTYQVAKTKIITP